jgi:autotransporter passenger strand-loop-strand repeat protein
VELSMTVYTVPNGRTSTGLTLNLNDSLYVQAGGKAVNTTVNKGGYVSVSAGGIASNTTLNTSGREEDYGLDSGARVSGGSLDVFGVESSGKIFSGGTENIWGQGTDFSASIMGGIQIINNGGTAISATVSSGGVQDAGFLTSGTRVVAGHAAT